MQLSALHLFALKPGFGGVSASFFISSRSMSIQTSSFKTPYGELLLGSFQGKLCLADWKYRRMRTTIDKRIQDGLNSTYVNDESEVMNQTMTQLTEYFDGARTKFDIPLLLVGSDFQRAVWETLVKIPFGTTESYLNLSRILGNEKAIRAVASANGANAISIIVPCHRIIGSKGDLTGYAGGLPAKNKLLILEGALQKTDQLELTF